MSNQESEILNLKSFDPFSTTSTTTRNSVISTAIHIRIQQRTGRKLITTVQGIPEQFDKKKLLRAFKKTFACNGTVVDHTEYGEVMQLQGDQRQHVYEVLCKLGIAKEDQLKVHGF